MGAGPPSCAGTLSHGGPRGAGLVTGPPGIGGPRVEDPGIEDVSVDDAGVEAVSVENGGTGGVATARPWGGSGPPTLERVAESAGVSRATVSRVVNGSPRVSATSREAVLRAIEQLGYTPNRAARSLVTRRADSIALVVSESESRVFGEPFFAGIVRGVSQALAATDLQLVLVLAQTGRQHARVERFVRNNHVDGVLLISLHGDDPLPRALISSGVPVVMCGRPPSSAADAPYVDADNFGGARAATQFLLDQGRRRIASITGPQDMAVGMDRLAGYQRALRDRRGGRDLVRAGDFSRDSGEHAMARLLTEAPELDAVFAASDLMAAGAVRALRRAGRRVPDDVAVVGFDDSEVARYTEPPLTSVRQPIDEMGREMVRLLLAQLDTGGAVASPVILPTELVVRSST